LKKLARQLPSSISTAFQGNAAAFSNSLNGLGPAAHCRGPRHLYRPRVLYENFIHRSRFFRACRPPVSGLITLLLFHEELNIMATSA